MNQSPRIKLTLNNGGDANPEAVGNRPTKRAVMGSRLTWPSQEVSRASSPYRRWAPPSVGRLLVSSRVF